MKLTRTLHHDPFIGLLKKNHAYRIRTADAIFYGIDEGSF